MPQRPDDLAKLAEAVGGSVAANAVRLEVDNGGERVAALLASPPVAIAEATIARPTLEDVFLRRTGRGLKSDAATA